MFGLQALTALLQLIGAPSQQRNLRTGQTKRTRHRLADAGVAAGNEGSFTREIEKVGKAAHGRALSCKRVGTNSRWPSSLAAVNDDTPTPSSS